MGNGCRTLSPARRRRSTIFARGPGLTGPPGWGYALPPARSGGRPLSFGLAISMLTAGPTAGQAPGVPGPIPAVPAVPETLYVVDEPPPEFPVGRYDRFWVRSAVLIGFTDRPSLPAGFVVPATGTAVAFPPSPYSSAQG